MTVFPWYDWGSGHSLMGSTAGRRGGIVRRLIAASIVLFSTLGVTAVVGVPTAYAGITVPGAPAGVTATPGNGAAVVKWTAPTRDGGSTITGYTVTTAPGGKTCTTKGAKTCTVHSLTNGASYTVTVKAKNVKGFGPSSPRVQ